jgi:transcriptional/translational regulatory protein YebC/TACO1
VRSTFTRHDGSLGEPGSVAYLFEQKGYLLAEGTEDIVMEAAIEGGAEDVRPSGEQWEIITAPGDFRGVLEALQAAEISVDTAEVTQLPTTTVAVSASKARTVLRLVDALDELDDVQAVFGNFDMSDEVLAEVAG